MPRHLILAGLTDEYMFGLVKGNDYCNVLNNNCACGWDGGDCCVSALTRNALPHLILFNDALGIVVGVVVVVWWWWLLVANTGS